MKKSYLALAVLTAGIAVQAADDSRVRSGLMEVQSAQSQTQILFNEVTTPQQKERVRYISQKLAQAENYLQQALNLPTNPPTYPPPYQGPKIELYENDSCYDDDLIGIMNSTTDCNRFASSKRVWSIKVNGQCIDTNDTTAPNACHAFKAMGSQQAVKLYHSDTCSDSLVAVVDYTTECERFKGLGMVWAIEIDGQCKDVSDQSAVKACQSFKP